MTVHPLPGSRVNCSVSKAYTEAAPALAATKDLAGRENPGKMGDIMGSLGVS